jgi:hypothetical protein
MYDLVYGDPIGHLGTVRYDTRGGVVLVGDVASKLLPCPDHFKCLAGGPIRFAIPDSPRQEWEAFDQHFEIVAPRTVRILGEEVRATLIRSTHPKIEVLYLYSEDRGLLGFGKGGEPVGNFLWLEGKCGFAAKNCR